MKCWHCYLSGVKCKWLCIWSSWRHFHAIIFCFIKIQTSFTFPVPAYTGCPRKRLLNRCLSQLVSTLSQNSNKQIDTQQTLHYYIHLTAFFSRTTWVSRCQKSKPFWILLEQEMTEWQWHQLDHMQIICTSLQTDNHSSTSSPQRSVFTGQMRMLPPNQQRQSTERTNTLN